MSEASEISTDDIDELTIDEWLTIESVGYAADLAELMLPEEFYFIGTI